MRETYITELLACSVTSVTIAKLVYIGCHFVVLARRGEEHVPSAS